MLATGFSVNLRHCAQFRLRAENQVDRRAAGRKDRNRQQRGGLDQHHLIGFGLGLKGAQVKQCVQLISTLYKLFNEKDCDLIEINPLIVTDSGELLALDAKINLDDNALYRHAALAELHDESQQDVQLIEEIKKD